jgi:bifunctional ADP-heptose synthase (sugar kinase/adenylyltransferase)
VLVILLFLYLHISLLLTNNIVESIRFANECATIIVQHKGVNKIGDFIKIFKNDKKKTNTTNG